jgi:hypothetical protein
LLYSLHIGFAQRYNIQSPEEAVKNPRSRESWGNALVLTNLSMLDMTGAFLRDFGVGTESNTPNRQELNNLRGIILRVLDK